MASRTPRATAARSTSHARADYTTDDDDENEHHVRESDDDDRDERGSRQELHATRVARDDDACESGKD